MDPSVCFNLFVFEFLVLYIDLSLAFIAHTKDLSQDPEIVVIPTDMHKYTHTDMCLDSTIFFGNVAIKENGSNGSVVDHLIRNQKVNNRFVIFTADEIQKIK